MDSTSCRWPLDYQFAMNRRGHYPNEKFDFLGYNFRPRRSKNRWGKYFVNFSPGESNAAA